ncbi:hypothetical protein GCM10028862_10120 [Luteimonas pelagia]
MDAPDGSAGRVEKGLSTRAAAMIAALGMLGAGQAARAQQLVQHCRSGNTCMVIDGIRSCGTVSHCWFTLHRFDAIFTEPEGIAGGIRIPRRELDLQPDAVMDCWKDMTPDARLTSGFPYRNDGVTPHNGIDVASDSGNYGHGAPVRSLGAGVVHASGFTRANGNFVRIDQGNGFRVTYIHLLDYATEDGALLQAGDVVGVGMVIGHMNCTGNCGGGWSSPYRGTLSKTHVHVEARRLDDERLADPIQLHGGQGCGTSSGGEGGRGGVITPAPCSGTICNEVP